MRPTRTMAIHRALDLQSRVKVWRRAGATLRREGPRSLWFKVLGALCYRRLLLVERVLDGPTGDDGGCGGLTVLTTSDLNRYGRFQPDADLDEIAARLARGDMCLGMIHTGELIHACWVRRGRAHIEYLDCEFELPSDVGYAYEAYTKPEFRGRGVAGARARLMEAPLSRAGYRAVLSAISPENGASLYFNRQAGHKVVGLIGWLGLGPWRWYFCRVRAASFPALSVGRHCAPARST